MTANQASMIGPKARPIFAVPSGCNGEQGRRRIATAAGST